MKINGLITSCLLSSLALGGIPAFGADSEGRSLALHAMYPSQQDRCSEELMELLKNGERNMERDRSSVDQLIEGLFRLSESNCAPVWKSLTQAYLANYLLSKYNTEAWNLNQRSALMGPAPANMNEWSANIFFAKIMEAVQASLVPQEELQKINLSAYGAYLQNVAENRDESLFRFLATNGLDILGSIDNDRLRKYYSQAMPASSTMFLPTDDFVRENFSGDNTNIVLMQLRIWQQLLEEAAKAGNQDLLVETDLNRLNAVLQLSNSPASYEEYKKAVGDLFNKYRNKPQAVRIALPWLESTLSLNPDKETESYKQALVVTDELLKQFPGAPGNCELRNFGFRLRAFQMGASIPAFVLPGKEVSLTLNFKNSSKLKLTLRDDSEKVIWTEVVAGNKAAVERQRETVSIPGQPYGHYVLEIADPDVPQAPAKMSFTVTSLFPVYQRLPNNTIRVLVVDSETGKPVEGVAVKVSERNFRKGAANEKTFTTSKEGMVDVTGMQMNQTMEFRVEKGADRYREKLNYYLYQRITEKSSITRLNLFTDRSVYRPGQTVRFKGILWKGEENGSQAVTDKSVEVSLYDANSQLIETKSFVTDDFGALSGEFMLPKDRLDGSFRLSTQQGSVNFEVAQYKRPSFFVDLQSPLTSYTFGDSIRVEGVVKTYSGVALGGARVSYSVYYGENLWRWSSSEEKISSGEVTADPSGKFVIPFESIVPGGKTESNYASYRLSVSVTDGAGETQEGVIRIPVGKSALVLSIGLPEQGGKRAQVGQSSSPVLNKDSLNRIEISVKNLSGISIESKGNLTLYRLSAPEKESPESTQQEGDTVKVASFEFTGGKPLWVDLKSYDPGYYLLEAVARDAKGSESRATQRFIAYSPADKKTPVSTRNWFVPAADKCRPGETATLFLGTSDKEISVLGELFDGGKLIESTRFTLNDEVREIKIPYRPEYGNQLTASYLFVKEGALYRDQSTIERMRPSDELFIRTDVFRDKLLPGAAEEWRFTITDASGKGVEAQVMADLYDASLESITAHNWYFQPQYRPYVAVPMWEYNFADTDNANLYWANRTECPQIPSVSLKYGANNGNSFYPYGPRIRGGFSAVMSDAMRPTAMAKEEMVLNASGMKQMADSEMEEMPKSTDLTSLRTNLEETAFFYPKLLTDNQGRVSVSFTMPQALTEWNFMLLANTRNMKWGELRKQVVTAKPFMVNPNFPRFLRQGDRATVAVTLMNNTDKPQRGEANFLFFDPSDETKVYGESKQSFEVGAGENKTLVFDVDVPAAIDLGAMRITAGNQQFSDGEQQMIPILPTRTLVTQSMTMNLTGGGERSFRFDSFMDNKSGTLQNYRYTVEYTGNPAWYAVQALPSVSTVSPDNASAAINSFFVNSLASYIASSNPQIRVAIDQWSREKGKEETLLSKLEKNESLKQLLLQETPWVLEAKDETESMQLLSRLFDKNREMDMRRTSIAVLKNLQSSEGGISWYPGMPAGLYQSIEILTAFARLTDLNAIEYNEAEKELQYDLIRYCDREIERLFIQNKEKGEPGVIEINWVCMRGSYRDIPFTGESLKAHKRYVAYVSKNWKQYPLYQQAIISLALRKYGEVNLADKIARYLKSITSSSEEMGIYWANNRYGYDSGISPLKTHVALMDALKEAGTTVEELNGMKLWLLKQKQVQSWGSSISTAEAIYGILMGGTDWLKSNALPVIRVGGHTVAPNKWIAYADTSYSGAAIVPQLGEIVITQRENHPGYGAAYWQFFEDFSAVKEQGKELKIQKQLYLQVETSAGVAIQPVQGDLQPGDIVVTRLVVNADRDYSYVTLKDQRAACFEPTEQLSGSRWDGGLSYYLQNGDAATCFYFTYLPKGTHVFEYRLKCDRIGSYQDGISTIQSLYSPEFVGNTQSGRVTIK